jgi:hypothetical protein
MQAQLRTPIILSLLAGGAIGWLAHSPLTVRAASDPGPMQFQLQGTGPATQLGVYFGAEKDLYVYQGVGAGSSSVNCSFKLHMSRPGGPVERVNCAVGKIE